MKTSLRFKPLSRKAVPTWASFLYACAVSTCLEEWHFRDVLLLAMRRFDISLSGSPVTSSKRLQDRLMRGIILVDPKSYTGHLET